MDFSADQLGNAMNVLAQGAEATTAISKSVAAIQGLFQRAQKPGDSEMTAALAELTQQVQKAKLANAELHGQLAELKMALIAADEFAEQAQRYERWETPAGFLVRRLKDADAAGEPLHFLCPACFGQRSLVELQGYEHSKTCPRCETTYRFEKPKPRVPRKQSPTSRYF